MREIGGQRAKPRDNLRYCSCGIVAGKKSISFFRCGNKSEMLQNSTPCSVMEQMFVIQNHMFCNIRLQTNNMPETRFCCGGVAGRLREHRFWWGFCFQNSEFGCWTRRWISWSSNGSLGLPMALMVFPSMSAVAPPNDPGHPKSLS